MIIILMKIVKMNQKIKKFVKHVLTFSDKLLNQKIMILLNQLKVIKS